MNRSFLGKTFDAVLLLILISAVLLLPVLIMAQPPHPAAVSQGWQYRYGDSPKNTQGIPLWVYDKNDSTSWKSFSYPGQPPVKPEYGDVWLRTQLPSKDWEIPSIMFTTNDQLFELYLEDKMIYNFGNVEHHDDKVAPGSPWHIIRLPENYQGKTVYLRMHTLFNRNLGLVRRFEIGSENEHYSYLIANEIDNLLLTTLFTFLGLCLLFIYMVRKSVKYEFPALGLFSISIGIWLFAETNFKQLFIYAPRPWQYVAFLSFYLMPVGFMIFVERVFSPGNMYMRMMVKLHILFAAVAFILDFTRLVPVIFTLQAFYMLLFLSVVTIFATIVKNVRANSYETKIFIWGLTLFLLFALYDILGMYFRIVPWSQYIIPYGMFIFLLSMIYILGRRFAEVYDKLKVYSEDIKVKNEALHHAYKEVNESKNKLAEWNRNLEQMIQKRTASVRNLLDNAGQGFLTFGADLAVGAEFSSECYNIFDYNIKGKSFPELIYPDNAEERDFLETLLGKILNEEDEIQRSVYLTLLPEEISLGNKYVQISFKIISDKDLGISEMFMVILTDVTYNRMLESKVLQESNALKMVVKVITNYDDFIETLRDYNDFCIFRLPRLLSSKQPHDEILYDICRTIHTFKGTFSMFDMLNTVLKLHAFEEGISDFKNSKNSSNMDSFNEYIIGQDIKGWIEPDISILKNILGEQFLNREDTIVIQKSRLKSIEEKMLLTLPPTECRLLLPDVIKLRQKPFKEVLKGMPDYTQKLADRMDKMMHPVEIYSDDALVDLDRYQGFSKVLIHVFRNIVDHGLETPDERLASGKEEYCNIRCEIKLADNMINLTISDDGRGFDFGKIRQKLIAKRLLDEEIACTHTDNDTIQLMINNHISTKDDITYTSGRGLGLSSIKNETEKLGGSFRIVSSAGFGTQYLFQLPYDTKAEISDLSAASIMDPLIETARNFIISGLNCETIDFNKYSISKLERVLLKDFTCFVGINGLLSGSFVVTMDRKLAEKLLENILIGGSSGIETEMFIEDLLAESSNIIIGNSIKKFPGIEDLIVVKPPITVKLSDAMVRFTGTSVWSCNIESEYGNMSISFIVPFGSDLDKNS